MSRRSVYTAMLGAALAIGLAVMPVEAAESYDWSKLSPEVQDFIKDNFLSHASEFPDADESVAVLRAYVAGTDLLRAEDFDTAVSMFEYAVRLEPTSRHAHAGLGFALRGRYEEHGNKADLAGAVSALLRAHEIGVANGRVRYTDVLAEDLGRLRDVARLGDVFEPLLAKHGDNWLLNMRYARGLALAGAPDAEKWFARSVSLRPADDPESVVQFGRWLIGAERMLEAYDQLAKVRGTGFGMADFLFGYSAEALGRTAEAREAYRAASAFSHLFPVDAGLRTALAAQQGVEFEGAASTSTHTTGHTKTSQVIYCESRGEGTGGMRAVGWTIRSRVFRGTEKTGCVISNSGTTLWGQYYTVAAQSGQFCGGTTRDSTTDSIAQQVYDGSVPDAYNSWCPAGSVSGSACTGSCTLSTTSGAHVNGATFFYSTTGTCATVHPSGCGSVPAKTCGNGGSDHCFYRVP